MIEKVLFSKVELWIVLFIVSVGSVAAVFLAYLAQERVMGEERFGKLGSSALYIAHLPKLVRRVVMMELDEHEVEGRFDQEPGFAFSGDLDNPNYVLLSRYDGDIAASVLELIVEGETTPLHRWDFASADIYQYEPSTRFHNRLDSGAAYTMRAHHPLVSEDGHLFVHFGTGSPLYRLDECSSLMWMNDDFAYHHSLERDADGNFWTPGKTQTALTEEGFDERYHDDYLVQISPDGKTLFSKSVTQILIENDLINRVLTYDIYHTDPMHLNDVEPVLTDGPLWRRGDVFLSLGHLNMLLLYRPSENAVLWWSQDLVMHQHDIDIVDETHISVFNNRRTDRAQGEVVLGANEILIFDLATDTVTVDWQEPFQSLEIRTINQGLTDHIPGAGLMVEEPNYGRLIKLSPEGEVQWVYVNKSAAGKTYTLNWSRYIPKAQGDEMAASLAQRQCGA